MQTDNGRRMSETSLPSGHRSGYVALIGRPNVGKSTLLNAYLGQSVAAVSPKPQTTRARQLAVLTLSNAQIIFVDTPGIHQAQHRLGKQMIETALEALRDADLLLVLFDLSRPPTDEDAQVAENVLEAESDTPYLVALNKVDRVQPEHLQERWEFFEALLPSAAFMTTLSATRGDNRDLLLENLIGQLPEGPRYFPIDQITDLYERDIAADQIRAAAMQLLRDEVPYGLAVRIDEFKERGDEGAYIAATIFVERESQKGIVIGKGGAMIREIGTLARKEIEAMSGRKSYLNLRVKTLPGWTNDEQALQRLGVTRR